MITQKNPFYFCLLIWNKFRTLKLSVYKVTKTPLYLSFKKLLITPFITYYECIICFRWCVYKGEQK